VNQKYNETLYPHLSDTGFLTFKGIIENSWSQVKVDGF